MIGQRNRNHSHANALPPGGRHNGRCALLVQQAIADPHVGRRDQFGSHGHCLHRATDTVTGLLGVHPSSARMLLLLGVDDQAPTPASTGRFITAHSRSSEHLSRCPTRPKSLRREGERLAGAECHEVHAFVVPPEDPGPVTMRSPHRRERGLARTNRTAANGSVSLPTTSVCRARHEVLKWWRCSPGVVLSRRRNVRFIVSGVPKPQVRAICSIELPVVSSNRQADSSRTVSTWSAAVMPSSALNTRVKCRSERLIWRARAGTERSSSRWSRIQDSRSRTGWVSVPCAARSDENWACPPDRCR